MKIPGTVPSTLPGNMGPFDRFDLFSFALRSLPSSCTRGTFTPFSSLIAYCKYKGPPDRRSCCRQQAAIIDRNWNIHPHFPRVQPRDTTRRGAPAADMEAKHWLIFGRPRRAQAVPMYDTTRRRQVASVALALVRD